MPKCPSKACVCVIMTVWILVGMMAFTFSCVFFLEPFIRVGRYRQATCMVDTSFYTTQFICRCGLHCESSYPCFVVHVSVNVTIDDHIWTVTLYDDDDQQMSVVNTEYDQQERCSLRICKTDSTANRIAVTRFEEHYGNRGVPLPCFYDSGNIRAGAVLHMSRPGFEVFHALFWPFLWVMFGALFCIVFCRRCQKDGRKKTYEESNLGLAKETPEIKTLVESPPLTGPPRKGKAKPNTSLNKWL